MSDTGLFVSLVITVAVMVWVLMPLIERGGDADVLRTQAAERQRQRLTVYYERVLRNLHDIDEDHATGKLSDAEHQRQREPWVQRGVQALRALDTLTEENLIAPSAADQAGIDTAIDQAIEDAVRKHLEQSKSVSA